MEKPRPETVEITARVENFYIDTGDEIVTNPVAVMPAPPGPLPTGEWEVPQDVQDWVDDHLFSMTGTGRTKGDAAYDLTVTASSRPDLVPVGLTYAWGY